jgi:hypothetical protein
MRRAAGDGGIHGGLGRWLAVAIVIVACALPVEAIDLSTDRYTLKLDTALSWGGRYRVEDPDPRLIGLVNGGTAFSVNGDDGNLNFSDGMVSSAARATVDLDFSYGNFGAFVRGTGFYDYIVEESGTDRTPLHPDAEDWVGSRAELLDAFVWAKFGGGQVRLGRQVLNWGESTFTQGGLNSINPVDVGMLRIPGTELREAFRPSGYLSGSFDLTNELSVEAFYQYEWEKTVIDPAGTYFSTADFAGLGGRHVFLGFGSSSDIVNPFFAAPNLGRPFLGVQRAENDRTPSDDGQYGLAVRWFAPQLGGTEIGFYYMNYHSRLPVVNALTGTVQGAMSAAAAGQAAALRVYGQFGVPPGANPTVDAIAQAAGTAAGTDAYGSTARYFFEYPEDIKMFGIGWNAQLGTTGIAFQGEISHQQDKPFLVDDVELLLAALSPISPALAQTQQVVPGGAGFSTEIPGYRRLDATQIQFTMTKVLGPLFGADQGVLVWEPAVTHVAGMPSKDVLRFEGPGTYTSGNPIHSGPGGAHAGKAFEPAEAFADPTSWGYQLAGRLDYNNAIGPINLAPRFAWQHDVDGVTPGPGGNFIEGRHALTGGVAAGYLNSWEFDLSYTTYGGAGRYNLINDRDFVAAVVKYSF